MQQTTLRAHPPHDNDDGGHAYNNTYNSMSTATASVPNTSLVIRNVTIDARRTSVRLEPEMWQALTDICRRERCSIHNLCTMIASLKDGPGSLTAAIRVFIMSYYRDASTEDGHNRTGHGSGSVLQPLYAKLAREAMRNVDKADSMPKPHNRDEW